jgi:hypothetical protein
LNVALFQNTKNGAASLYSDAGGWKPVELVSNVEEQKVFFSIPMNFCPDVHIATPTFTANIIQLGARQSAVLIVNRTI